MKAEIITIGDEILIGQTLDSNSGWIGKNLAYYGVKVNRITSISDTESEIISAIDEAFSRSDLILMTGGLGPTNDDITKKTLAKYYQSDFYRNEEVEALIKGYFASIGREPVAANLEQAELPSKSEVIINKLGTASGMWFYENGKALLSMPGVPYEMKGIMKSEGFDKITSTFKTTPVYNRTILTIGLGESRLAEKLIDWETSLRNEGLSLAYLPSAGTVRLRVSAEGEDLEVIKKQVEKRIQEAIPLIENYIYGYDEDTLARIIAKLLTDKNETLSLAESCTGGYISHLITTEPGSSKFYDGGLVTYSYEAKEHWLGVDHDLLLQHGAVSESVVEQMAMGVRDRFKTTYGISASGIAGPGGATEDKPVGTVWVGIAGPNWVKSFMFTFGKNRMRNIVMTSHAALNLLRKELLK